MAKQIQYKGGYKYQLHQDYTDTITITPQEDVTQEKNAYIQLDTQGNLTLKKGYAWDGPSGPTIDTKNFMRGSLVHDALYQLIREGHLKPSQRDAADKLIETMCKEDGMSWIRAKWVYKALKWFGSKAAKQSNARKVITAP